MVTLADMGAEALSRYAKVIIIVYYSLTPQLCSILTSEPLTLLPSNSDNPTYIHERLLSSVSPALSAAYQREWKESKSRVYKFLKDDDGFYTDVTKDLLIRSRQHPRSRRTP
jgi:hypothetical protein